MEKCFVRSLLHDVILLKPEDMVANYKAITLDELKRQYEGMCSRHGYIKAGSISLHKIVKSKINVASLSGNAYLSVHYFASVCNPVSGVVLPARVINMNKFGVMTRSGIDNGDGTFTPVVESIIMRSGEHTIGQNVDKTLDKLSIGDEITIEIIGTKFDIGEKTINSIATITDKSLQVYADAVEQSDGVDDDENVDKEDDANDDDIIENDNDDENENDEADIDNNEDEDDDDDGVDVDENDDDEIFDEDELNADGDDDDFDYDSSSDSN